MSHTLPRPAAQSARPTTLVERLPAFPTLSSEPPRLRLHLLFGAAAILTLMLPVFLTGRTWGLDWSVHEWVTYDQGVNISGGGPSLYSHSDQMGIFYPLYAFYGGTMYTIGGALSALLGNHVLPAFVAMIFFAYASAYGGLLWLSLQAGLRNWQAHAASLIFVSSPYWLTNAYGRGAYSELVATSVVPLLIAATIAFVRADRVRFLHVAAFVYASVLLTGSHNITMMWGSLSVAALGLVALWALPRHGLELPRRRIAALAGLFGLGVAVNAWFLLPDLAYSDKVQIAATSGDPMLWYMTVWYDTPSVLFAPIRGWAPQSDTKGLYANLPMYTLLWAVISAGFVARRSEGWVRRALAGLAVILTGYLLLMLFEWPWHHVLPTTLSFIQFRFRLQTYIVLVIALLAILVLRSLAASGSGAALGAAAQDSSAADGAPAPGGRGRVVMRVLVAALALSFGLGIWQTWSTGDSWEQTRADTVAKGPTSLPPSWYDVGAFKDLEQPVVQVAEDRRVVIPPTWVVKDRLDRVVTLPGGDGPIGTNIAGGTYLVKIEGPVAVIGRDDKNNLVLKRTDPGGIVNPSPTNVRLRISPNTDGPVMTGRRITFAALFGLGLVLAGFAVRAVRQRGRLAPVAGAAAPAAAA